MLYTNLKHIESAEEFAQIVAGHDKIKIICGKMDPSSVSMYRIAEELEPSFKHVKFFDMEFDNPESFVIRNLPEVQKLNGMPLVVYFKDGEVVHATAGLQEKSAITAALEHEFTEKMNA